MRYFFDTEFLEDGQTIDLMSIGIACEDGRTYYATVADFNVVRIESLVAKGDRWLLDNVVPLLPLRVVERTPGVSHEIRIYHKSDSAWKSREQIKQDILAFVGPDPEWWAYYADYDWVALCQIFGRMIDLPKGWPMYCRDYRQVCDEQGWTATKQEGVEHHALADALWLRDIFRYRHPPQWPLA